MITPDDKTAGKIEEMIRTELKGTSYYQRSAATSRSKMVYALLDALTELGAPLDEERIAIAVAGYLAVQS